MIFNPTPKPAPFTQVVAHVDSSLIYFSLAYLEEWRGNATAECYSGVPHDVQTSTLFVTCHDPVGPVTTVLVVAIGLRVYQVYQTDAVLVFRTYIE